MDYPRPTRLGFFKEGTDFFGYDPDNDVTYSIGWCGNGAHSHYLLEPIDAPSSGFYSFIHHNRTDESARFHDAIREAEYWLIYHATPDGKARPKTQG